MKKIIQSIFALIVCSVIFLTNGITTNAAGEPTVTYNGKQKEFTLKNVIETDLFQLYKGLIPGDTVEQKIVLKVKNLQAKTSIYLRAECEEEVKSALEGTTIDVYCGEELVSENQLIFDDVLLGIYAEQETEELRAVIHIPTAYSNEISEKEFHIQWIFTAQEDGEVPKTGDNSFSEMNMVLMLSSMLLIIRMSKKRRYS